MTEIALGKILTPQYRSKLESDYGELLQGRLLAGEILAWWYEDLTLRIGFDCRLTIDFFVQNMDRTLEAHEVKGPHKWEDSIVKLRAAADKFPLIFRLVTRSKEGEWRIEEVGARKKMVAKPKTDGLIVAIDEIPPPPIRKMGRDGYDSVVRRRGEMRPTLNGEPITMERAKEWMGKR